MFYRRKVLLALLESFGGSLKKTDCQKLLFLFCQRRNKNYYDFFPYKYGSYSFLLYQDKIRMTNLGYLADEEIYKINGLQSFIHCLNKEDYAVLSALVTEIGEMRGEHLIRKVYLEQPYYASRSKIAVTLLNSREYEEVSHTWNKDKSPCLFTIGYEGMSIDAYLNLLIANNIRVLVDVRKNPISMKYGFSKKKLSYYIESAGMMYIHLPELGIASNLRQELHSFTDYQHLFEYYSSQILPEQTGSLNRLKTILHENARIAITCFEADPQCCHRHRIVEYLKHDVDFETPIIHLKNDVLFKPL